jgi:hypothetical protein
MQHIRTLNLLFSGTPQVRFNRKHNKLFLDISWQDFKAGDYVIVECYRKLEPDTVTLTGTLTGTTSANTMTGYGTVFDQELVENDMITLGDGQVVQVNKITSPTTLSITGNLTSSVANTTVTKAGITDVWDDRMLKKYATALLKKQWGENMKKFGGIQMPGGVTLNGKEIWDEAVEEIKEIEEDMFNFNSLPSEIFTG